MFGAPCFGELPFAATHPRFASGAFTLLGSLMTRDHRLNVLSDESDILVITLELYPRPAWDRS